MHRFKSDRRLQISSGLDPMKKVHISIRIALAAAALLMAVSGYVFGDPFVIWQKAASICLECIGIG